MFVLALPHNIRFYNLLAVSYFSSSNSWKAINILRDDFQRRRSISKFRLILWNHKIQDCKLTLLVFGSIRIC